MKKPKDKHIFGIVKVGKRGQIVIPKEARNIFNIEKGDNLILLGDEKKGLAILKREDFYELFKDLNILDIIGKEK